MLRRRCSVLPTILVVVSIAWLTLGATASLSGQSAAPAAPASAKTWIEQRSAIEEFIRTADCVKMEEVGTGVTKPRRCELAPGGPVDRIAFKPIQPGIHQGFWDSYTAEIAAYELDKLLELDMVPPAVEKRVNGDIGAAVMWLKPVAGWTETLANLHPPDPRGWDLQVIRMKMFDNLICNKDRNAGNILVDPAYHLLLIDHSRAFISERKLPIEMTRVDRALWQRMQALTLEALTAKLGKWVGKGELRAVLDRRERMKTTIDGLVAKNGEAEVYR